MLKGGAFVGVASGLRVGLSGEIIPFYSGNPATDRVINGATYRQQTTNNTYALTRYTNLQGEERYRMEVRSGDTWSGDVGASPPRNRVEWQQRAPALPTGEGAEIWWSDTVAVENEASITTWVVLSQLHYGFSGVDAVVSLAIEDGTTCKIYTAYSQDTTVTTAQRTLRYSELNFPILKWVRFVFWVKFGVNGNGAIKVWRDGIPIVDDSGINIGYLNDSRWSPHLKWGCYRRDDAETYAVQHTNVEVGEQSLEGRITSPLPIDPRGGVAPSDQVSSYTLPTSFVMESFDNITDFTAVSGAILSIDTDDPVQGTGALAIASQGTGGLARKANIGTYDPASLGTIAWCVTGEDDAAWNNCEGSIRLAQGGSYPFANALIDQSEGSSADYHVGTTWYSIHVSENTAVSALSPSTAMGIQAGASQSPFADTVKFDALLGNAAGRPTILLRYDDLLSSQYINGFPLHQARGIPATVFVPTDYIDQASRWTTAQLLEAQDAGWGMGLDGTPNDSVITTFASVAAWVSAIEAMQDVMTTKGLTSAIRHMCYPNGVFRVSGTKTKKTGVVSDGSNVVVVPDNTGIAVGNRVVSYLISSSSNIRVTSIAGTSITLDGSIPAGTAAMAFVDDSSPWFTNKPQAAIRAANLLDTGWTTLSGQVYSRYGVGDRGLYLPANTTTAITLASFQSIVDLAILRGTTAQIYMHAPPSWLADGLDYLVEKRDAGVLDVLNVQQWWERDCANPIPPPT